MELYKYPKTHHLPWSEGATSDDKTILNCDFYTGKEVVVTEKMDGENTTMYQHHIHARSVDSRHHPSRDWVKNYWNSIRFQLPKELRVCGENLFAKHSLEYKELESFFYGFSVWEGKQCWNWDDTVELFEELDITYPKVMYRGVFDEKLIRKLAEELDTNKVEGYVMRTVEGFNIKDFSTNVAKFVRKDHVTTDKHWSHQKIEENKLK